MGSSGEANTKGVDASVGGLVWVRRRNGSWWPGRILGLDELSESCLISPRSGTPVKLLGREDASIDWYNLEKSKRVKAFRCGEYDECIEKAKVSAANPNKKAVKYARREDAILHALEIESAQLGNDHLEVSYRKGNGDVEHGILAGASPPMSDSSEEDKQEEEEKEEGEKEEGEKEGEGGGEEEEEEEVGENMGNDSSDSELSSGSAPGLSQSVISFEEPNHISSARMQSGKSRRTPNDSEDDGTEGVKRMKGLEDLGMGVLPKRKALTEQLIEPVQQEIASLGDANAGTCIFTGNPPNGMKVYSSSVKRKRSPVPSVHEFLKRKHRRRTLAKVLESTAMVSVPVICEELPNSCSSTLRGVSHGRLYESEYNEARNNFVESARDICEEGTSLASLDVSLSNLKPNKDAAFCISSLEDGAPSDRLFDVPFVGEEHFSGSSGVIFSCSSGSTHVGASGMQTSLCRRGQAAVSGNEGLDECGPTPPAAARGVYYASQSIDNGSSKWRSKGKRNVRHANRNRKQNLKMHKEIEDESNGRLLGMDHSHLFCRGCDYPEQLPENPVDGICDRTVHRSLGGSPARGLTTEVKELPVDSLKSHRILPYQQPRLTVGSRFSRTEFAVRNCFTDGLLYDVKLEVKANYRPQHVPLVSMMSKLNGKAIVGHPLAVDSLEEGYCDDILARMEHDSKGDEHGCNLLKQNAATERRRPKHLVSVKGLLPCKSPKVKKSGQTSKKIRKLSLLSQNQHEDETETAGKPSAPSIACIPLKVVFSRINEAINGFSAGK